MDYELEKKENEKVFKKKKKLTKKYCRYKCTGCNKVFRIEITDKKQSNRNLNSFKCFCY